MNKFFNEKQTRVFILEKKFFLGKSVNLRMKNFRVYNVSDFSFLSKQPLRLKITSNYTIHSFSAVTQQRISLPLNARNIAVKKLAPSMSRIQLTDPKTKTNFLKHYDAGEIKIGDDFAVMERPESKREEVFISGPLKTDLLLQVDYKVGHPVNISYQFALMKNSEENEVAKSSEMLGSGPFAWEFLLPDEECSVRCDGGSQQIPAVS